MNESDRTAFVHAYLDGVSQQLSSGHAREHAYRPALERLMNSFDDTLAVNDPARSENGNPDFVFLKRSNKDVILGYAEAKDITVDLDKTLKTEQLRRYAGYEKLFLTNYRDFIFLENGEEYERISLGSLQNGVLNNDTSQTLRLANELQAFLARPPESIRSGKRLAVIMGGKARRIRDNVREYLKNQENEKNKELEKIYELMKKLLVHDLTPEQFSDLYAQTLVYGLFAARYNDDTPGDFNRREAVENVPKTNPFLRQFFNHIAGADFDSRLRHIVDELCEVFSVSDIQGLVHRQVAKFATDDERDATIHFYEDFLKEYDPAERKKMGVYYTPVPVVKYIVRSVDKILKEEFGISKGLASTEEVDHWFETGQEYKARKNAKDTVKGYYKKVPRVQVLDPAVGTATFLNETIKHIYKDFEGQEGRWPAYVKDNLVERLHGFELMMAPYTIAHLKLSMTLQETGVKDLSDRLGVYLTNSLEEGIPSQQDLFSIGFAEAVSEESRRAADIKSNQPIMVVMGNPPYSVSSNNKSKWIENLVADYKKDLNERNIQPLSDDYIKFLRFAEDMVARNGTGIVAMITNNSYIDGLIHRQMRKHLLETFDKIYVLDLHGNSKKKETAPDGSKDVNVFDIQQGVGIILCVKTGQNQNELADVYHAELYGARQKKFNDLDNNTPEFKKISPTSPNYYYVSKDMRLMNEYRGHVSVGGLFVVHNAGVATGKDSKFVGLSEVELRKQLEDIEIHDDTLINYEYRPFDTRYSLYDNSLIQRLRTNVMKHVIADENTSLVTTQLNRQLSTLYTNMVTGLVDRHYLDSAADSMHVFPLYLYHEDGTRTPNFAPAEFSVLTHQLTSEPLPEDILDYIYAVLHSPSYREKYKEFLKIDFPRVPVPSQAEFNRLVSLGRELRELHLMKSSSLENYDTTFPEGGSNEVEKLEYKDERVYINETQYFGNVPEIVWNFYIGGYQPAQKWLKDRKGRKLSDADLDHYQKIVKILLETDRIMKQIG